MRSYTPRPSFGSSSEARISSRAVFSTAWWPSRYARTNAFADTSRCANRRAYSSAAAGGSMCSIGMRWRIAEKNVSILLETVSRNSCSNCVSPRSSAISATSHSWVERVMSFNWSSMPLTIVAAALATTVSSAPSPGCRAARCSPDTTRPSDHARTRLSWCSELNSRALDWTFPQLSLRTGLAPQ